MPGVSTIVRFGDQVAAIPDPTVIALACGNHEETVVIEPEVQVGDEVRIADGAFHGLEAVVTQVLPAKERVRSCSNFSDVPWKPRCPSP